MAAAFLVFTCALARLAECAEWSPPPPMPDRYDWVQLTSGEWLKGEVKVIYDDSLEFDSDKLDLLKLDMADVQTIRSAHVVSVRMSNGEVATGKLLLEDGPIKVLAGTTQVFQRDSLLSVTAGVPTESNYWSGKVSVGGNFSSGNTDRTDVNVRLDAKRRTVEDRIEFDYIGDYRDADGVQSANSHRATALWDRFVSERLFLRPVSGQYYRDPFQNIAQRLTVGTGVGYELLNTPKSEWTVFAGAASQHTRFSNVLPGASSSEGSPAFIGGTHFNTQLTSKLEFIYGYQFQITNEAAGRRPHHMTGTFEIDLIDGLDLQTSLIWDRTAKPKANADGSTPQPNDYQFVIGVGVDF